MGEVCLPCRSLCRERLIFVPRFNSLGSLEVGQGKSLMNAPRRSRSGNKSYQSVENASVAFVKGANERNEFFEKNR